jgi:hypothetical protein
VRDAHEIERAIAEFAHASNGGLIVLSQGSAQVHRALIIADHRACGSSLSGLHQLIRAVAILREH